MYHNSRETSRDTSRIDSREKHWCHYLNRYFIIWELILYLLRTFYPHLGSFCVVSSSLRFGQISALAFFRWLAWRQYFLGIRLQDSAFLSDVTVNHLKKARGEFWPKRSEEETTQKLPRWGQKSAKMKKLILRLRSLISKILPIKDKIFIVLESLFWRSDVDGRLKLFFHLYFLPLISLAFSL